MHLEWGQIKEEIVRDTEEIFSENNPSYPNILEGIELFRKVIYSTTGGALLSGLHREIIPSLNDAYIEKVGELSSLKTLANALDPYLKKICIISGKETEISVSGKTLRPLLEKLSLIPSDFQSLREPLKPGSLAENLDYTEYICESYQTRNKVHESPNWGKREVLKRLSSIIVVYIYSALKYKSEIDSISENEPTSEIIQKISEKERYLYHFITFGNTTHKIKNQIISSYILNYLKENQPVSLENIHLSSNAHFENNLEINRYKNLISILETDKKVIVSSYDRTYKLSDDEYERISQIQENFNDNRNIFFLLLEDIAEKYNIGSKILELFDKLQEFVENNFNIDFSEAYDKGIEIDKDENVIYQQFITYIQSITFDKECSNKLFRDLLELSVDSDFLLRMSASKAFANLTNPDRYEQYINQQERVVYLDTQIILYALCLNYVNKANYGNYLYESTEELIDLARKNKNIRFKFSKFYLQEVAYQLKFALLLIPFEGIEGRKLSSNIFYQFYWHLKENDLLEEDDETFSDFMSYWFQLDENDAYDNKFFSIAYDNITNYLTDNLLNIEVEILPQYEKTAAVETIEKVIFNESYARNRPKTVIDNDAFMLCHLCNRDVHVIEPFFLTWDKLFVKFRKDYVSKHKRSDIITFHLFNPSRFISHLSLTKFKINPKAITNDFLSIIDSYSIQEKSSTFWDTVNKFLNIDNIGKLKRSRYATKIKEIVEKEFNSPNVEGERERILSPFEGRFESLNDYYSNANSKYSIYDYRNLLLAEDYFDKATQIIFDVNIDSKLIGQKIDELIQNKKDKMK